MRKLVGLLFLVFASFSVFAADDFKKLFYEAQSLMYNENYEDALPVLLSLDSLEPNNANIMFQIGMCYYHSPLDAEKAIPYLEKAVQSATMDYQEGVEKEKNAPHWAYELLGMAYSKHYEFDKAIMTFEQYKKSLNNPDSLTLAEIDYFIKIANNGKQLVAKPINMEIANLGPNINSKYADYKPVLMADESEIIFTSRRAGSTGDAVDMEGKFFEDIYVSKQENGEWSEPQKIGGTINTDDHEATVGLSADGQILYIYKFLEGSGDIYFSELDGFNWTDPQKMGSDINQKSWESHASVSADGRFLFFTSDRPGGFGGTDIYFCRRLPDNSWGLAINMGRNVNSPYDEDGGYLHPDGENFFFSSKGHSTMGGFDIMTVRKIDPENDLAWTEPTNLGYPVNTTGDDVFYVPTTDGTGAYYSSFRKDGFGDQDIYKMTFPDVEQKSLTVYKGEIHTHGGIDPADVKIEVFNVETDELVGEYVPNSETGKYLIVLQHGVTYDITYEGPGCFFHSDHVEVGEHSQYHIIEQAIDIDPLKVGMVLGLNNIFYEYDKADLTVESTTELERLRGLMEKCPHLVIEIEGHTDSKGNEDYNLKLSQARAQSVVDYLIHRGIDPERLKALGHGEAQLVMKDTDADGNYIEEAMAKNRRTEMTILATDY